jgi:cytochrome o ubiquinol oxidase subunit I
MLGKLNWSAIPLDQPIPMITSGAVALAILGVLAWVAVKGHLPYLWKEWITSVDHKRIGVMYTLLAMVMLLRGFADAIMMRSQQAIAYHSQGYLPPEHFNQIFSAHGTIMIFFVAMPFVIGLMNLVVPLQLGVRDVAFPTLNSVGFWLTATGALLVNISLVIGEFARTGWLPFPPLSELTYSPGVGVDYYLWSLEISGVGTLVAGINLVTTVLKLRTRGMTYLRMPMFCWTTLATNLLIVAAFPILTATLAMLILDRYFGFHFFTNEAGGNMMMFMNLIWAWGPSGSLHPRPAGIRHFLRSRVDVLRQAAVRLSFDGAGHDGDLHYLVHGMAASFLHYGRRPRCQRDLRHRQHDHRGADRREDLQLAVHDVWRARSL